MFSWNGTDKGTEEPTILVRGPMLKPPESTPTPHCMALVKGTGQHLSDEVHEVLRRRLRIACTISTAAFLTFYLRHLLQAEQTHAVTDAFDRALNTALVAILVLLSALLWTKYPFSSAALRSIELIMFGSMAVYFADLQFRVYYPGSITDAIYPGELRNLAPEGGIFRILVLGNSANNTRWFFLIVLYGMFIPNTWKRCTLVVGCMALTPIILTLLRCPGCAVMGPYTYTLLLNTVLFLSMSVAMAVFGSHRINQLQQRAYQARKLGQYQLQRKLGTGGMGEVYLGEHVLLRRACAIKLIRPEHAGDPTTLSRFEREVQAMATLTHWNTVEVYDYGRTEDGTFYYVMEYLPGLSLQELVDLHGPVSPGRAIYFLRQLCAALQEAHAVGLIHRDIKPSNVIVCKRGNVFDVAKLLDFGLVQEVGAFGGAQNDKLTIQGTVLGSPNFLSPEQARGKGRIDARTDIYSLGALGYFLVTGQPPFVRDTVMDLLAAHMKDDVVPPRQLRPEIPVDLEDILLTCLRKNSDERIPDADALDRALASCESVEQWDAEKARDWWRHAGSATPLEVESSKV